jgi:hypothetical protein
MVCVGFDHTRHHGPPSNTGILVILSIYKGVAKVLEISLFNNILLSTKYVVPTVTHPLIEVLVPRFLSVE